MTVFVLFLNIILMGAFFIYYKKKQKKILNIGTIIILLYFFLSVFSLVDYQFFADSYDGVRYPASFFSAVYFFLFWIFCFSPISIYSERKIINTQPPRMGAINAFLIILILIVFVNTSQIILNINELLANLFSADFFYEAYTDKVNDMSSNNEAVSASFNFFSVLNNITADLRIFMTMYYFSLPKRNKWIVVGLAFSLLLSPLSYILNAARGGLVRMVLLIISFYFVFNPLYGEKVQKRTKIILSLFLVLLTTALVAITVSRFTRSYMADDYMTSSIFHYLGCPIYNFESCVLDAGGTRHGDRILALFKYFLMPGDGAYTFEGRLSKYSYMKIGEDSFSTFIGDVVLDFGPVLSVFMAILFIGLLRLMGPNKKRGCQFYHLIPLYMLSYLFLAGWPLCPYADIGGNLKLVFYFLVYIYFYLTRSHKSIEYNGTNNSVLSTPVSSDKGK